MKNSTEVIATPSELSTRILLTAEEAYFLNRFIWNQKQTQLLEGLQAQATPRNVGGPSYSQHEPHVILILPANSEQLYAERIGTLLTDQQTLANRIEACLDHFESSRTSWQNALDMTLNAEGLIEIGGGES